MNTLITHYTNATNEIDRRGLSGKSARPSHQRRRSLARLMAASSALLALGTQSVQVHALSTELYPAAFCDDADQTPSRSATLWSGAAVNRFTSEAQMECPAIARSDSGLIKTVSIAAVDRSCQSDVRCRFTAQWLSADGVTTWWETAEMKTTGCSTARQLPPAVTANFGTGAENLSFMCSVPPVEVVGTERRVSQLFHYKLTR